MWWSMGIIMKIKGYLLIEGCDYLFYYYVEQYYMVLKRSLRRITKFMKILNCVIFFYGSLLNPFADLQGMRHNGVALSAHKISITNKQTYMYAQGLYIYIIVCIYLIWYIAENKQGYKVEANTHTYTTDIHTQLTHMTKQILKMLFAWVILLGFLTTTTTTSEEHKEGVLVLTSRVRER